VIDSKRGLANNPFGALADLKGRLLAEKAALEKIKKVKKAKKAKKAAAFDKPGEKAQNPPKATGDKLTSGKAALGTSQKRDFTDHPFGSLATLKDRLLAEKAALEKAALEKAALEKALLEKAALEKAKKAKIAAPARESPEPDEETLFRLEMADVKPLKNPPKRLAPAAPDPSAFKRPAPPDEDQEVIDHLKDLVAGRSEFDLTYADEYVEGSLRGMSTWVMEELRRGRVPYEDYLDLHGLTLAQAQAAIDRFVIHSASLGRRCLLLVHGRGKRSANGESVIKRNLEDLLLRRPIRRHIEAFTTARPVDGGLGASYVLLKR
jgi:DNA-nicking Smr family endonuclease